MPPAIDETGRPSLFCEGRPGRARSCRDRCPCARRRYRYRFTHLPASAIRPVLPSALCSRALFSLPSLPSLCFCASMACPTSYTTPLPPPSATTQRVPARSHAHAHEAFERRTPFVPFCFSRVLLALRLWAFIAFRGTPRTGFVRRGRREDRLSAREAPCAPLCSDRLGAFAVPAFRLVSRALVVCVRVLQR